MNEKDIDISFESLLNMLHTVRKFLFKPSDHYKTFAINYCRTYIHRVFGDDVGINYDAIEIWDEDASSMNVNRELKFGNLYSYVIASGIPFPYSEWLYENELRYDGKVFGWVGSACTGTVREDTDEMATDDNGEIVTVRMPKPREQFKCDGCGKITKTFKDAMHMKQLCHACHGSIHKL